MLNCCYTIWSKQMHTTFKTPMSRSPIDCKALDTYHKNIKIYLYRRKEKEGTINNLTIWEGKLKWLYLCKYNLNSVEM